MIVRLKQKKLFRDREIKKNTILQAKNTIDAER